MYVIGQGHEHLGPGTSMVQFANPSQDLIHSGGLGCADCVTEFLPDRPTMTQFRGMGCGCKQGLGFFDGGFDPSTWGTAEYVAIGVGLYLFFSVKGDVGRGARAVKGAASGAYRGAKSSGGGRKSKF